MKTKPQDQTVIRLGESDDGGIAIEVELPDGLTEETDELPEHTKIALDIVQALGALADNVRKED